MYDQISRLERLVFNQHLREGESRAGWLKEILDFQAEDGSFALVDSPRIESDARVEFCYEPSYLCSALLMEEVMRHKEPPEALVDALRRALKFCCGRGLQGHGYESEEGEERAMGWFLRCGLEDFTAVLSGLGSGVYQAGRRIAEQLDPLVCVWHADGHGKKKSGPQPGGVL